jgi:autotransporter translocation and assembly factor TamB
LPPFMEQTRLDIRVRETDQLWVDNNLARLRLHTDMRIIGSPVKPNFSGRVNVEEGYVLYLDRKFEIKTGNIMFLDPNRLNPELELRAESSVTSYQATEASKYLITFSVTGTMEEPVINLTSQPPLDKPDIVSLLTVGATRSELLGKEGNGQAGGAKDVLKSRAGSLASQQISGYLGRKAGDFLGLDQVTVEGNLFQPEGLSQARVLASKRISERVAVTYSTTVGHLNDQSFRLDYKLSKRFSLEGQTDQRGRSSANLKYRLLFR